MTPKNKEKKEDRKKRAKGNVSLVLTNHCTLKAYFWTLYFSDDLHPGAPKGVTVAVVS